MTAKEKSIRRLLAYCQRIQPSSLCYKIVKIDGEKKIRMIAKPSL